MADCYVVVVRHNLVTALRREASLTDVAVPQTKLEVGTQLAENYRQHGCIDGDYLFDNPQRAKIFAVLCLEFTQALVAKRLERLQKLPAATEYDAAAEAGLHDVA